MEFTSIPLKGTEYLYTYRNSQQISGQTGLVGYLRADFGSSDCGFFNTWNEFRADYNTDKFKAEFYAVIDYFREKGRFLHKRRDMTNFCYEVGNAFEYDNGREYGLSEFIVFSGAAVSVDHTCTIDEFVMSVKEKD